MATETAAIVAEVESEMAVSPWSFRPQKREVSEGSATSGASVSSLG
jgi:hypothetical protein